MASISLVSVNVERSKHFDLVRTFIEEHRGAEVVCIQELMERDIPFFEELFGCGCHFSPETRHPDNGRPGIMGNGIFSTLPVSLSFEQYYHGNRETMHDFDFTSTETKDATEARVISFCDVEKDGQIFRIATTHFTWTPKGDTDDYQRRDITLLLSILEQAGDFILTGDFNAPRGGEIFSILADAYTDNIPSHYMTSLDPDRHRAPQEETADKMVDGLFTTPAYIASDVVLHTGVSDHCAVTATITRL